METGATGMGLLLLTDPQPTVRKLANNATQKIPDEGKTFMKKILPNALFSLMFAGFSAVAPKCEFKAKK
jgi:hypothetical protein